MQASCLIFSRDRACQLDALLRSISRNAPQLYSRITVYYKATSEEHHRGYAKCMVKNNFPGRIFFVPEGTVAIQELVRSFVRSDEFISFLVDDDIIYRPAPVIIHDFPYSLRLGVNTRYCHAQGQPQRRPILHPDGRGAYRFNWTKAEGDFGYPFSLDGTIYHTVHIDHLISRIEFDSPTRLEAAMDANKMRITWDSVYCGEHSCLVGLPHNRVTEWAGNPVSGRYTTEELNRAFLMGHEIDFERMDFSNIYGSHQEVSYEFRKLRQPLTASAN